MTCILNYEYHTELKNNYITESKFLITLYSAQRIQAKLVFETLLIHKCLQAEVAEHSHMPLSMVLLRNQTLHQHFQETAQTNTHPLLHSQLKTTPQCCSSVFLQHHLENLHQRLEPASVIIGRTSRICQIIIILQYLRIIGKKALLFEIEGLLKLITRLQMRVGQPAPHYSTQSLYSNFIRKQMQSYRLTSLAC